MATLFARHKSAGKDPFTRGAVLLALILCCITWALLAWRIPDIARTQQVVALHYNVDIGVDEIGPWTALWRYGWLAAAALGINTALVFWTRQRDRLVSMLVAGGGVLVQLCALVAVFFIILVNLA